MAKVTFGPLIDFVIQSAMFRGYGFHREDLNIDTLELTLNKQAQSDNHSQFAPIFGLPF